MNTPGESVTLTIRLPSRPQLMSELIIEEKIQRRYFDYLHENYSKDVLVMNWEGWYEKATKHPSYLYGEFDIARFSRVIKDGKVVDLILTGYEVKGVNREWTDKKQEGKMVRVQTGWQYPRLAKGIDQALVLLMERADYSFLVTPTPESEGEKRDLITLRNKFVPHIGLIFADINGGFTKPDEQRPRNETNLDDKLDALIRLYTSGKHEQKNGLFIQPWARDRLSFYHIPDGDD